MALQIAKFFGGSSLGDAAALAAAIDKLENERETARGREQDLALARVDALLTADDAQIDSIEKELAAVQRSLDRYEVQLPELRRRHARQDAVENFETKSAQLDALVVQRIAASREIDGALIALGKIFEQFEATSEQLLELQTFHLATGTDGGGDVRRASPRRVVMAAFKLAPLFARCFGQKTFAEPLESFAQAEEAYWTEIQRKTKQRDPSKVEDAS
jgi:hypothetical protein